MRISVAMKYLVASITFIFFLVSCGNHTTNSDSHESFNNNSSLELPSRFVNNTPPGTDQVQDYSDNSDEIQEYPDDIYCAEVAFYNPNTGTHSSYTLTVAVEDNEVTRINFPNGGWLDSEHFSGATLDDQGLASFTSDKGYDYEIHIIGKGDGCFTNVPSAVQCMGRTRQGRRCKNMTDNPNQLCWQHQLQDDEDLEEDEGDMENDNEEEEYNQY
ncbi:hypothetical protein [Chitinophaga sp.]|uniref:hypothetical protein n=1 Tax=Chitinophaga sp. TaxID=1869181 RepID=UPI002F95B793